MYRTVALLLGAASLIATPDAGLQTRSQSSFQPSRLSPHETVAAIIDGARVAISYGRPSMRGRAIFGSLVPYGRVWCPGADEATTVESTTELLIANLRVARGPHTIWILPTPSDWTLIVSKEPRGFHTRYNPERDLGRVVMQKRDLSSAVERLTFAIVPSPAGGGSIVMSWEKTEASVPFSTRIR